jgi:ABC-2 type transport system permease protein
MTELPSVRLLLAVVRRDLRLLVASRATLIPLLVLPAVVFVLLPLVAGLAPGALNLPLDDLDHLVAVLPELLPAGTTVPSDPEGQVVTVLLVSLFAPMILVVPVMLATVAAASAIAGERERRTLELLLLSPITDRQLLLAKTLGAWVPALVITVLGSTAYQVVATALLAGYDVRPFPNLLWTLVTVWVSPAIAAVSLLLVVVISGRSRTVQDAIQLGGVLVLPLIGLLVAQSTGVLLLTPLHLAVGGGVLWVAAGILLQTGARALRRDVLATQL